MVLPATCAARRANDLVRHRDFALVVDLLHLLDERQRRARLARRPGERRDILREAGAAIARPRMQELVADPAVGPYGACHLLDIRAHLLAKVGDLVDEADLHGEESVRGIFRELGAFAADEHDRRIAKAKRLVDAVHDLARPRIVDADEDAIGVGEILDRRAFPQKFGVGADREIGIGPEPPHAPLDLAARADRHRRFRRDNRKAR